MGASAGHPAWSGVAVNRPGGREPRAMFAHAIAGWRRRPLTPEELDDARAAWQWFDKARDRHTGLVPLSSDHRRIGSPRTLAQALVATRCAQDLGLVASTAARAHIARLIETAAALPAGPFGLPESRFDTATLAALRPPGGVSCSSAIECLVLAEALAVIASRDHTLKPAVATVLKGWALEALIGPEGLVGHLRAPGTRAVTFQEGRIDSEPFALRIAARLGLPARPEGAVAHLRSWRFCGADLPADARGPDGFNPVTALTMDEAFAEAMLRGWSEFGQQLVCALLTGARADFIERLDLCMPGVMALPSLPSPAVLGFSHKARGLVAERADGRVLEGAPRIAVAAAAAAFATVPTAYTGAVWDRAREARTEHGWCAAVGGDGRPAGSPSAQAAAGVLLALRCKALGPLAATP